MSLTVDPHDFIQDQINSRAQDPVLHSDLSDDLTQHLLKKQKND